MFIAFEIVVGIEYLFHSHVEATCMNNLFLNSVPLCNLPNLEYTLTK